MTKRLLMVCVVGLMAAAPAVCTAVTISEAVADADDGMYVQMDDGSSMTLAFTPPVTIPSNGLTVKVYLSGLSRSIRLQSGSDYQEFGGSNSGPLELYVSPGLLSSLMISGISGTGDFVAYVDGVEVLTLAGPPVDPQPQVTCSAYTGTVTPLVSAVVMIADLVDLVASYNLVQGIDNSLDAKLAAAVDALEDMNANNDASAANNLGAFIHEVEAQSGKKITEAQATELVTAAQKIITILTGA